MSSAQSTYLLGRLSVSYIACLSRRLSRSDVCVVRCIPLGYCELVDYVNRGGPLSPLTTQTVRQLAGREPITVPTWVENKLLYHIKSQPQAK